MKPLDLNTDKFCPRPNWIRKKNALFDLMVNVPSSPGTAYHQMYVRPVLSASSRQG
jgi:hypothetical protein